MIWTSFAKVAFKILFLRNTILREFYNLANFSLLFFRWRVAIAIELQLLQTPAWKSQKHTVLPHSQIVRVNNRVNRQIFANLSSSKGGSLTAASTSTTTSRVLHIPSFFYEYVVCGAATGNGIISAVSPSNDLRTKNRSHLSKLLLEYCVCVQYSLLFFLSHFHSFSCKVLLLLLVVDDNDCLYRF